MKDEYFICTVCGAENPPLGYTARNHCRECLCSLHLDEFPGDRASDCGGIMRPVTLEQHKKGQQIVFKCEKCGKIKKNITASDDVFDLIIKLSSKNVYEI
jgi:hypothetical protein